LASRGWSCRDAGQHGANPGRVATLPFWCCKQNDSQLFRSQANSLPGANQPIGLWPNRSLELSPLGPFAPWPICSLALSLLRAKWPRNFRSIELLFSRVFTPWNFLSLLVCDICDIRLYCNDVFLLHSNVTFLLIRNCSIERCCMSYRYHHFICS